MLRLRVVIAAALGVTGVVPLAVTTSSVAAPSASGGTVEVNAAIQHDVSPPLASMTPAPDGAAPSRDDHGRGHPARNFHPGQYRSQRDSAVQSNAGAAGAATAGIGFAGVGNNDYSFAPDAAPPDTNGAVGSTQYLQWVNEKFAVFDKTTGKLVYGPVNGNTLWTGFGGGCETNNDGDPIVKWDPTGTGHWLMTQFSVSTTPYLQCVAVSQTADATGAWNRYAFVEPNFNDYPKVGIWDGGYYVTYNMFQGNSFVGARACLWHAADMMAGRATSEVCNQFSSTYGGLLPADVDGSMAPQAGSPEILMNFGTNVLNMWTFSATGSVSGPVQLPVASFTPACNGGTCIPQKNTKQRLDSLADRLMYRLAHRNYGGKQSLVVNHSVAGSSVSAAIRWYQLQNNGAGWSVAQQGTYAPNDGKSRWMGSIAQDKVGDIAVGYSESSATSFPSIAYTGRTPTEPAGTLESETLVKAGLGSQLRNLNRWGDYSSMVVDPTDDCTFWFTTEYLKASGTFNWSTWITSFRFPSCQ